MSQFWETYFMSSEEFTFGITLIRGDGVGAGTAILSLLLLAVVNLLDVAR